jgi:shikimate kinase
MKPHVALVGFMASGKSTLGRKLAQRLGCAFVDTDELVAREYGAIATIFSEEGEAAFRRYEHQAISSALESESPSVVALGGGALTVAANRSVLQRRAYRIFVRISPAQVLTRVRASREPRPVLGPNPTLETVRELYERRMPQYARADYVVAAEGRSRRQVLDEILQWLRAKGIAPR